MAERVTGIANAVCVDDTPQAVKQRCREEGIHYSLLSEGLIFGTILVCRTAEDAAHVLRVYGDLAHKRLKGDHC
ncbi:MULTISPECIES: hypothetical protein [unclassified Sphingobium]|jgi:hypothetical protein|uniref:hypothetical protein n=1 Tax=Sphingobium TaxID=165695 RepID=UPI0013DDEEE3|nr:MULTISPECIES: hypothetical protein [unclassified Sphingobium]MBR2270598.1 hypothetical protein [Sphingobium sp.]